MNKNNQTKDDATALVKKAKQKLNETKKISIKKIISTGIKAAIIATGAIYSIRALNSSYIEKHPIFEQKKVENDLKFYGGDSRAVMTYNSIITPEEDIPYNHLWAYDTKKIKVGISDKFTQDEVDECKNFFEYLNNMFETINPDYHFEVGEYSQLESRIWISKNFSVNKNVYARAIYLIDSVNHSRGHFINIVFNKDYSFSKEFFGIILAHEMYHVMMGSKDIDQDKRLCNTIYDYTNCETIARHKEQTESNVYYMPTDVATMVALYGDSSKTENIKKYVQLIDDTLTESIKLLGKNYTYFKPSFNFDNLRNQYLEDDKDKKERQAFKESFK